MPVNDWTETRTAAFNFAVRAAIGPDRHHVALDAIGAAFEATDRLGYRFIIRSDPEWPARLNDLADISFNGRTIVHGLWLTGPGNLADWVDGSVAMVGARAATRYGETVAHQIAQDLAAARTIVSGGAFGIDAASHRGALMAGGRTIALMPGGLDIFYPPGNSGLFDQIAHSGLLVSEYPPGMTPNRPNFLQRNRLIAALSDGVVVVEGATRSGAANTASWATALGRPLMAVPGPVTSIVSATPHRLIREHTAELVTDAQDITAVIAAHRLSDPHTYPVAASLAAQATPHAGVGPANPATPVAQPAVKTSGLGL